MKRNSHVMIMAPLTVGLKIQRDFIFDRLYVCEIAHVNSADYRGT